MIGPVHENDTKARVNAIRKMLRIPVVLPAFSSTLFVHDEGSLISKPPRNDAPKTSNIRKKNTLNNAFVASLLSAAGPKSSVTAKPSNRYITTIDAPYIKASRIACFLSFERLRKKLTVIGMIGHTQGVSNASRPPPKPRMKVTQIELLSSFASSSAATATVSATGCASTTGSAAAASTVSAFASSTVSTASTTGAAGAGFSTTGSFFFAGAGAGAGVAFSFTAGFASAGFAGAGVSFTGAAAGATEIFSLVMTKS